MQNDKRDLRDPEALGEALLRMRDSRADCQTLSQAQDVFERAGMTVPDYDPTPPDHSALRYAELRDRAAGGDKFAAALLNGGSAAEEPVD